MYFNGGAVAVAPKILLTAVAIPVAATAKPTLSTELVWLGITVPTWLGWLFFVAALIFGSFLSTFQDSTVDNYIHHKNLKPIYSFGWGLFFTLFGIPLYWENITVWQLVLPALASAAVGAQMVYYMISSGKYMVEFVFKKIGIKPPPTIKDLSQPAEVSNNESE